MTPLDLDDAFEDYMRKVNPMVYEQSIQYKESRRVFFAGVAVLYFHVTGAEMYKTPENECVKELQQIEKQLMDFKKRVEEDKV